jgi:hypothetical protein
MIFEVNYQKSWVKVKKNLMMYEEYDYTTRVGKTKQFDEKECEILTNLENVIEKFITVLTNMSSIQFDEHYESAKQIKLKIFGCDYDTITKDSASAMEFLTELDDRIKQFKMLL